ncbi:transketolase [Nematocida sp. LUAm3]|nr:transketolase [Nematocida sp. LUAm3]KAI5176361.1 transketolase [Nematocida sp. LUAm2]KAI5179385.1 transketolase [Nematocida sp. LUAm1]
MGVIEELRAAIPEVIAAANSGHPGSAMSLSPLLDVLFRRVMLTAYTEKWMNRDIFVLSNGHACPAVYCILYLLGYLERKDLFEFRTINSVTPGHPEPCSFMEAATGPLGQGVGQSVGYAIALWSMRQYNRDGFSLFTNRVFCVAGDGCMQEGVSYEALAIAGHLKISNLVVIYDRNRITIDGALEISGSEDIPKRMEAFGYEVEIVREAEDQKYLEEVLKKKRNSPLFIQLETEIAKTSLNEGSKQTHGAPLSKEDVEQLRKRANVPEKSSVWFSEETKRIYSEKREELENSLEKWNILLLRYKETHPQLYEELMERKIPPFPSLSEEQQSPWREEKATRQFLHMALNLLKSKRLFGGSADLSSSTLAHWKGIESFSPNNTTGQEIHFGIREHGMCSILSGISGYNWHIPFGATFLNFLTYGFPAVRIAALSKYPLVIFGTHDSIGLGEDGPSHQPVEVLSLLRATPNITVIRPADGIETLFSVYYSLYVRKSPVVVALTRQKVPSVPGTSLEMAQKGGYVVSEYFGEGKRICLIATGSEVSLALAAKEILSEYSVRVVSLLSFEIFEEQTEEYKREVLSGGVTISIEASSTFGWAKYSTYAIGIDTFGGSAPGHVLMEHFGFYPQGIADKVRQFLNASR